MPIAKRCALPKHGCNITAGVKQIRTPPPVCGVQTMLAACSHFAGCSYSHSDPAAACACLTLVLRLLIEAAVLANAAEVMSRMKFLVPQLVFLPSNFCTLAACRASWSRPQGLTCAWCVHLHDLRS